ncbi:MAG TPA: alpha/beta hydrolase [Alphaproteobacteria bacterium]|nr:alpha/beta hydrolase [Rhodospirillaceae bacterium]HRJ13300.1 alpha/beta hydrolase [Alphaproteobacteria bacterium]
MPEVIIPGLAGRIEARYQHSKAQNAPVALVCHPHPLHGGTMNNKVTYAMYQSFVKMGFSTLRFNYRGVGESQGEWAEGEGELADASSALDFLQAHNPTAGGLWITGFSFGAWVAMQLLMRRPETDRFVVVAPPANMFSFDFLAPCPCSGLILQGDEDKVVPKPLVDDMVSKLRLQRGITIDYRAMTGADHFFKDQMPTLETTIQGYITAAFNETRVAA